MKACIVCNMVSYIGEIISYSLTLGAHIIDLRQVKKISWSPTAEPKIMLRGGTIIAGDGSIEMNDGTVLVIPQDARSKPEYMLKGYLTLRIDSLKEEIRFDIQAIKGLKYPVKR
jgi:hypothetical protein